MRLNSDQLQNITHFFEGKPVKRAFLFGSYARGEADATSDIDILVDLSEPMGLAFFGMAQDLEDLMGHKVDLITRPGLSKRVAPYVERDLQLIYAR